MSEKLVVNRTLGFEIECGTSSAPWNISIPNTQSGSDGSVSVGRKYDAEMRTDPISDLNLLEEIYGTLVKDYEMEVNDSCGLHIHVDINDFNSFQQTLLARFGAGIQLLMFGLVDESRWDRNRSSHVSGEARNSYATKMHYGYSKIFNRSYVEQTIPFDTLEDIHSVINWVNNKRREKLREEGKSLRNSLWMGKYQWMHIGTRFGTVEYRIFNATDDYELAQKFGMLAYHIVEFIKGADLRQVKFLIKSLYKSESAEVAYGKLFDSIGLDEEFRPSILNQQAVDYIDEKYFKPYRESLVEVEAETEAS